MISIILYFVFFTFVGEFSYFFSRFTTVGTTNWFGNSIFKVENFVKFRLKMDRFAAFILSLSYSKAFVCRPCHSFWLSLAIHLFFYSWWISLFGSLLIYKLIKNEESNAKTSI